MSIDSELLRHAIANKRLLAFRYRGHLRLAEPHLYGRYRGVDQLLVYQVGGGSRSGDLPNWRRITLRDVAELRELPVDFAGPRRSRTGLYLDWDEIYAVVE
jgi:hypothetical protein